MKKKFLSICLAVCLLLSFQTVAFASEEDNSNTIEMYTVNLETGDQTTDVINISSSSDVLSAPAYIPEDQVAPNDIIDTDNRYRVPDLLMSNIPYSCIGVVIAENPDGTASRGTGFLIGPNDVVTCGHVLVDNTGEVAKQVYFYLGVNGDLDSHMRYTAQDISVPKAYVENMNAGNDWGTFQLTNNVGNYTGYLGWTTDYSAGMHVQVTGYPSDKPNYEMWMAGASIASISGNLVYHYVDTEGGESGSPIYNTLNFDGPMVVGIHGYGGTDSNYGRRVDSGIASVFSNLRNN